MKFVELVDISELRELCESFTAFTDAVTAILDLEGNILVATGWQDICTRFHRVNPQTACRCTESDTVLAGQLKKGEHYNIYNCKNGLVDIAVPITVGGEHVANFFSGQFFFKPPDSDFFSRQAEEFGFDKIAYLDALNRVPIYSEGQVKAMMDFFFRLARLIGEMGLARKRLEESNVELRRHQEHLEELVDERTEELVEAKERAETANHAKSTFLANMSHELRTPLNAILGFSDILRRDTEISADQKGTLEIIHKSGDHLLGLINDVLEIAKIEAGRTVLTPAPMDLGALILDVTDMLRIRAQGKGLHLLLDQSSLFPRWIIGDEAKLRQILINLLSNAIKATEQGGVTLRLGVKQNKVDHLLMEVEDTGCGIAQEDRAKIMQPFVQVGPQDKQQGSGLGLTISRHFVELMGGQLSLLTSTLGQGSTFRVDIPVQLAGQEEIPQAPMARGEVTRLEPGQSVYRVLVVEDQLDNQVLLVRLLESVGFQVRLAENGAVALELFGTWQPDFIWMDRRMPVMDGLEATRRIRVLPGGDKVRIAAITASTFKEEDSEMTAAGVNAIVHKPFRPEQIFDCMERLLGLRFVRGKAVEIVSPPSPAHLASAMATLPESLRRSLGEALIGLDSARILERIEVIGQTAPDLAAALRKRVQLYDYEGIRALLHSPSPLPTPGDSKVTSKEKKP